MRPPNLTAWGTATGMQRMRGGARSEVWAFQMNGLSWVARKSQLSDGRLRWIERLQKVAVASGLRANPMIRTNSGAISASGWTVHPFVEGHPGQAVDLRRLLPRIKAMHRRTKAWRDPKCPAVQGHVAVHGDLHPDNIVMAEDGPILLDWDEARIDDPSVDIAPILEPNGPLHLSFEVRACWRAEPQRARDLARRLGMFGYKTREALDLTR